MKQQNSSVKQLRSNKPLFASYSDITLEYLTKTKEEQDLYVFRGETEEGKYFILLVKCEHLSNNQMFISSIEWNGVEWSKLCECLLQNKKTVLLKLR